MKQSNQTTEKPYQVPDPYRSIVNRACVNDRAYFEKHPGEDVRIRDIIQGEFYPLDTSMFNSVYVTRIDDETRTREPFYLKNRNQLHKVIRERVRRSDMIAKDRKKAAVKRFKKLRKTA